MTIEALTPMLRTWDLAGSVKFYTEILGFTCQSFVQDWGWASLQQDGVSLMLSLPNEVEGDKAPAFTGSLYFKVSDVDTLWSRLRNQAQVSYPIENFEYGMREFAIYDNNGYLLQFGQENKSD